jgi:acyl carrier protein
MTRAELEKAVLDALTEVAPDVDASQVNRSARFRDQFDFDSMDTLNLVTALHRTLGVDIPEADYPRLASLDEALLYLERKVA